MRTISDEIDALDSRVDDMTKLLDSAIDKVDDGAETTETDEIADLREEIGEIEKSLNDALAIHDNSFERHAAMIAKRDGISLLLAMTKARHEYPADFRKYAASGTRIAKDAGADAVRSSLTVGETRGHALRNFNDIVIEVMKREGVTRTVALQSARKAYPDEFVAAFK